MIHLLTIAHMDSFLLQSMVKVSSCHSFQTHEWIGTPWHPPVRTWFINQSNCRYIHSKPFNQFSQRHFQVPKWSMHVHAPSRPWNSPSVKFGIKAILIRAKAVLNRAGTQAPTRGVTPVSLSFASLAASTKALYSSLATEDLWALGRIKNLPSGVQYHATYSRT
jgi:hypothetical protein